MKTTIPKHIKIILFAIILTIVAIPFIYYAVTPKELIPQVRPILRDFPEVAHFIYIPESHQLTDSEFAILKSEKIVDLILFENKLPESNILQTLFDQKYIIGLRSPITQGSLNIPTNIIYFSDTDYIPPECYADTACVMIKKTDTSAFTFEIKQKEFRFEVKECENLSICFSEQLVKQEDYKNVLFVEKDGTFINILTQSFPIFKISVNDSYTVEFNWESNRSFSLLGQSAYSYEVLDLESGYSYYKSGKKTGLNQGESFIPLTQTKSSQYKVMLRSWYQLNGIELPSPIYKEKAFEKDFKTSDLIHNNQDHKVSEIAWIPSWGMSRALESLRKNPKRWSTISPVWFFLKENGTMTVENTLNNSELLAIAKKNNIEIIPAITLFDPNILSKALNDHFDTHINTIVSLVEENNYAGIDINYESTYLKDKAVFERFIVKLSEELHKRGKKLVFSAVPKWSDNKIYGFLPQTKQAQDWQFMGNYIDELRIMGYDYTSQNSLVPGPLSPLLWNEAIIQYALTKLPAEKIVFALPLYSHSWLTPANNDLPGINNDQSIIGDGKNTDSWQHEDINSIKRQSSAKYTETIDSWNQEILATYLSKGKSKTMYYLNADMINKRKELVKKYKIKGIAYWRIGGEQLN